MELPRKEVDFIIVGFGIAGAILADRLLAAGKNVCVFDPDVPNTSSKIAAGLINPVTGRNYVKSWMIEVLLDEAKKYYRHFEDQFQVKILKEFPILRILKDQLEEERWLIRSGDPGYTRFLSPEQRPDKITKVFGSPLVHGIVREGMQVDFIQLMESMKDKLISSQNYISEAFDYQYLKIFDTKCYYKYFIASNIIFCEGAGMKKNPFFKSLPMRVNKGEILLLDAPAYSQETVVKRKHLTVPLKGGKVWFGSANSWKDDNAEPSQKAHQILHKDLADNYIFPWDHAMHLAAFRPAVNDRRPLLGTHSDFSQLHLFNGMGTKGASLVPYFSKVMVAYLLNNAPLPEEVNIIRFDL